MRIFLADDDTDIRSALQTVLKQESDVSVVGQASRVTGLLARIQIARPDLILLDWELPGQPSPDLLANLRALTNPPQVIVLSSRPEAEQAALAAGADIFISKGDPPERLLTALRTLRRDNTHP